MWIRIRILGDLLVLDTDQDPYRDPDSEGKIKADLDPGIKMNADPNPKM